MQQALIPTTTTLARNAGVTQELLSNSKDARGAEFDLGARLAAVSFILSLADKRLQRRFERSENPYDILAILATEAASREKQRAFVASEEIRAIRRGASESVRDFTDRFRALLLTIQHVAKELACQSPSMSRSSPKCLGTKTPFFSSPVENPPVRLVI